MLFYGEKIANIPANLSGNEGTELNVCPIVCPFLWIKKFLLLNSICYKDYYFLHRGDLKDSTHPPETRVTAGFYQNGSLYHTYTLHPK